MKSSEICAVKGLGIVGRASDAEPYPNVFKGTTKVQQNVLYTIHLGKSAVPIHRNILKENKVPAFIFEHTDIE